VNSSKSPEKKFGGTIAGGTDSRWLPGKGKNAGAMPPRGGGKKGEKQRGTGEPQKKIEELGGVREKAGMCLRLPRLRDKEKNRIRQEGNRGKRNWQGERKSARFLASGRIWGQGGLVESGVGEVALRRKKRRLGVAAGEGP